VLIKAPLASELALRSRGVWRSVAAWLLGYSSENTRTAYARDLEAWISFCDDIGIDPLEATRPHVDAWARQMERDGRATTTVSRRLAALSSWYSWLVDEGVLLTSSPCERVRRPRVSDESSTLGPTQEEALRLLKAASEHSAKYEALVCLLLLNGLRVAEVVGADVGDLDCERGHRVIRVTRKGGRRALVPLAPRTVSAIDRYLDGRVDGPLFIGDRASGQSATPITPSGVSYIVKFVARRAGIGWPLSPHGLRHGFVTLALEAGASITDVQDAAGHADPRTTRRYDRARHRLDAAPTYLLAGSLSD
jgi:site-specific recombinase XerD